MAKLVADEFSTVALGDERLNARARTTLDALSRAFGGLPPSNGLPGWHI